MEFRQGKHNNALLQDEVLIELVLSLRGGKPAGPDAFHALNNFIECCIIHNEVWVDPVESLFGDGGGLSSEILGDPFIQSLLSEGVLKNCPSHDEVDGYLKSLGSEYDCLDFITDLRWHMRAMCALNSEDEARYFQDKTRFLNQCPKIFERAELIDSSDRASCPEAAWALGNGFTEDDLVTLEGWNRSAGALTRFTSYLDLNLYVVPSAVPHQIGGVSVRNRVAREAYERIVLEFDQVLEPDIGKTEFTMGKFPALSAIVLAEANGNIEALAASIIRNRKKYSELRAYLSEVGAMWGKAQTKIDRISLQSQLDNAVKSLSLEVNAQKDRVWYKAWDVLKNPTKIIQASGDVLVKKGREEAVVGQVKGLRAFWKGYKNSPLTEVSFEHFYNLVPRVASESVFEKAGEMEHYIDLMIKK